MARYLGSVCRLCRREGEKLFLKGKRCTTPKCALDRKAYPPGVHTRRVRPSNYGIQLREKQKVKRIYGVLEKQFKNYFKKAVRAKSVTGQRLLELLETRLDNVVYRLGWAKSRNQARQLVSHGHILVDGAKATIPSYQLLVNKQLSISPSGAQADVLTMNLADLPKIPAWLEFNAKTKSAKVLRMPMREEIDATIDEQLIIEYYSR